MVEAHGLLVLVVRHLHGVVHEVLRALLVAHVLLLALEEDATIVHELFLLISRLRWNNLNVPMAWEEFHVRRAVKEHFSWDGRQGIRQVSQLVVTVSEAAVVLELADTCLFEVAANLSLIVRVHSSNEVPSWILSWHRLNNLDHNKAKSVNFILRLKLNIASS